jgi:hypothetical protein
MKVFVAGLAAIFCFGGATSAAAKGCIKGALVGGAAGHYAGHHGLLAATARYIIGHHEAKKNERMRMEEGQRNREKDVQDRL